MTDSTHDGQHDGQHDDQHEDQHVIDLIRKSKVAMLTYHDVDGALVAKPMATQDVDFDGTLRFIAQRDTEKVAALEKDPRVNVSYSSSGTWVSVAGTARVAHDEARLKELWNTFTGSWLDGGPEDPENVLIEIDTESAEYWNAPGTSKLISLANLVKAKLTGETIEADHGRTEL